MISKRVLASMEALRLSLANADRSSDGSFSKVFHAFLDLAEDPAMLQASKPTKSPLIRGALERSSRLLLEDDTLIIQNVRMLRCAGLVHGGFFAGSLLGTFFFFENEQQGLAAFNDGSPLTHYTRLTLTTLPEGTTFVPGPKGPQ